MGEETSGLPVPGEPGIAGLVPFGLDHDKPRHYREALAAIAQNADHLGYAWRVLGQGLCDACSLGPDGLSDDVRPGLHLCTRRLSTLRDHTVGAFPPADVASIKRLRLRSASELKSLGRIGFPFVYRANSRAGGRGLNRVSWDDALQLAGAALRDADPERIAWLAGPGLTNEVYYTVSKTAAALGAPDARLLGTAARSLEQTLGDAASTCSLKDVIGADLVVLWNVDPAALQPVFVDYLAAAKAQGSRIVVVHPDPAKRLDTHWIPTRPVSALFGTRIADDVLQIHDDGGPALVRALLKTLDRAGAVDTAFIGAHTTGWAELEADLAAEDLRTLLDRAGVTIGQVEWLAQLIDRATSVVSVWGPETREPAAVANLHLATGAFGTVNNGLLPLLDDGIRGALDCGLSTDPLPDEPDVLVVVGAHGAALETSHTPRVRIHIDTHLHPSMLEEPGELVLVLPSQGRYEQRGGGTVTSAERKIRFSPAVDGHPEVGQTRAAWEIPLQLAAAARPALDAELSFRSGQDLRNEMGDAITRYAGIENLKQQGDWIQWGGPQRFVRGKFLGMPDNRARFHR